MAEAIVSIVVGRITDLLFEEPQLLHGVRDEIQQVVTELRQIKAFLRDADSRIREEKIHILLADLRGLAYDAEHAVESFLVKALSTGKRMQWMNGNKFARKIKDIERKIRLLSYRFQDNNIKSTLEFPQSSNSSYGTLRKPKRFHSFTTVEPEIFVGFQSDVDRLVGHLVNENDDCYPLVSICGMGGLGKTTLAEKIYNHSTTKSYFSGGLAWVSISQNCRAKLVLQRILICLVHEKKDDFLAMDDENLVESLLQIQQTKKCLIVLDDIWSTDAWDSLKAAFIAEKSISKLMLTSRKFEVARYVNPKGFIHQPESLSSEQSWELLKLKALPRGDHLDTRDVNEMEILGREMVEYCAGLPLAIVILGGMLVTKPTLVEWEKVYDDSQLSLKSGNGLEKNYQEQLLNVLAWSYNDLPPQLKPCFLYFSKFREDELIEAETLCQLWIAEGMVLSSDKREGETLMQVAGLYVEELVRRSMVQAKYKDMESLVTKIEYCSLHDLMRDLSFSQAKAEDFFEVTYLLEGNEFNPSPPMDFSSAYTRQLVVYSDEGYINEKADSYFVKKAKQQHYRSLLLFNDFVTRSLPPVLGSHVANFRLLRVFSMEKVEVDRRTISGTLFRINLGRVLGSLVYLRYLSVRKTNLLIFPSIQKLVLLQTLKLDIQENIYFPPWMSRNILGKLGYLRHLYLPDWDVHRLGKNSKLRFNGLSKLEILDNFQASWCEIRDLPELINLRKLSLTVNGNNDEGLEELMKYLTDIALPSSSCLMYLALTIVTGNLRLGNCPSILRELLYCHDFKLQKLEICCELPELALLFGQRQLHNTHIDVSLVRITSLKLSWSCLEEDPMPILEKIPTLCELFLTRNAFVGKEMVCSAMGFAKLTRLELCHLGSVKIWRVEKGSMAILSCLRIRNCPKLEELPEGLLFLNSLERLLLCSMPSHLCDRVRRVNDEQGPDFYKVAHVLDISIYDD